LSQVDTGEFIVKIGWLTNWHRTRWKLFWPVTRVSCATKISDSNKELYHFACLIKTATM